MPVSPELTSIFDGRDGSAGRATRFLPEPPLRHAVLSDLVAWQRGPGWEAGVLDVEPLHETELLPFLTTEDVDDTGRMLPPVGRRLALASRALVRTLCGSWTGQSPRRTVVRRWCARCRSHDHGRPYVADPRVHDFSVSHAGTLVVVAWTDRGAVGVDLEPLRDLEHLDVLMRTCLTPAERRRLGQVGGLVSNEFINLWTRKESVVKLTGDGLGRAPSSVDVLHDHVDLATSAGTIALSPLCLPPGYVGHVARTPVPPAGLDRFGSHVPTHRP